MTASLLPDELIRQRLSEAIEVKRAMQSDAELLAAAAQVAHRIAEALAAGNRLLVFGNGGSAADATHIAAEFVGRYRTERTALPAISLSDNTSAVTAIANDYGYESVFRRQIEAFGRAGDVALGLTTSGTSPNVVAALEAARRGNLHAVAITGADGGACAPAADVCLRIPSNDTARVQEASMLLCHCICELAEQAVAGA